MGTPHRRGNILNQKFGMLIVIERLPDIIVNYSKVHSIPIWRCKCDCGNIRDVRVDYLIRGSATSCGCNKNTKGGWKFSSNRLSISERLFNYWKASNAVRQKGYSISLGQFISLIHEDCYYCGIKPNTIYSINNDSILINGIDRVDNTIGYTSTNCVSCCPICNRMKLNQTQEEFFEKIKTIYNLHYESK